MKDPNWLIAHAIMVMLARHHLLKNVIITPEQFDELTGEVEKVLASNEEGL